jgi:hypothetical protein
VLATLTETHQLARIAKDLRADLVAADALDVGRLREWAFGVATRDLLLGDERWRLPRRPFSSKL